MKGRFVKPLKTVIQTSSLQEEGEMVNLNPQVLGCLPVNEKIPIEPTWR